MGFAEDITAQKQLKIALEQVSQGVAAYTGENFFASLVKYLVEALAVDFVFIGQLSPSDSSRVQIIAVYGDGQSLPNFNRTILDTPCQLVIGHQIRHYPEQVRQQFPKADILQ